MRQRGGKGQANIKGERQERQEEEERRGKKKHKRYSNSRDSGEMETFAVPERRDHKLTNLHEVTGNQGPPDVDVIIPAVEFGTNPL